MATPTDPAVSPVTAGRGRERRSADYGAGMARPDEIRDTGRLVGDALRGAVRSVEHVHMSISRRTYGALGATLGPVLTPIRLAQHGLTRAVYQTVAGTSAAVPRAGAIAVEARSRRDTNSGVDGRRAPAGPWVPKSRSARAIGVLNGIKGDVVAAEYASLATPMALRDHLVGGDVVPTRDGLVAAYPDATDRIAVFMHGLCESDRSWFAGAEKRHGEPAVSYGSLLARELGYTPAYLRYNTGLPIGVNARSLAELLDDVVGAWPVEVRDIVLIGHSMGGLVIRSASHRADVDRRPWADLVRHIVCIGTPHFGAPLERVVDRAVPVIDRLPEARPLARFLHERSDGIKDLGHGVFADEAKRDEVPFLDHATYCFVGATITQDRHHPLGHLVGDLLVTYPSASGTSRAREIPFEIDDAHVGGLHHWEIVNHPTVYEHLRRWLAA